MKTCGALLLGWHVCRLVFPFVGLGLRSVIAHRCKDPLRFFLRTYPGHAEDLGSRRRRYGFDIRNFGRDGVVAGREVLRPGFVADL